MHTLGPGVWQENWNTLKMREKYVWPGIRLETLKNVESEKCTRQDLEYGEKTENHGKWETHTVGREIGRETMKNFKNEKYTL